MPKVKIDEREIDRLLAALNRNVALLERADRRTGLPTQLVTAEALAALSDDNVREAASTLEAATGRSKTSLADAAQFESDRTRAIEASHRLRSALIGYLERHRVRAPGPGIVLQYEAAPSGHVRAGDVGHVLRL